VASTPLPGKELAEALTGAATVVVDVSHAPSFDDDPVMEFFTKSTTIWWPPAKGCGNRALRRSVSIVGCDQLPKERVSACQGPPQEKAHRKKAADSLLRFVGALPSLRRFTEAITASLTVADEVARFRDAADPAPSPPRTLADEVAGCGRRPTTGRFIENIGRA